jgi:hypothetical protein
MQQTIQAILAAMAALLAGMAVVGALAVLILAEGYYIVGFGTRLYWRWKESMRQVHRDLQETLASSQDRHGLPHDRPPGSLPRVIQPPHRQSPMNPDDDGNRRRRDDGGETP